MPPPQRAVPGLRVQILVGLALVTMVAVILSGYLALWAAGDSLRNQREETARSLAAAAAAVAAGALNPVAPIDDPTSRARLTGVLQLLTERGDIREASVMGMDTRVVVSRPVREAADRDPPLLVAILGGLPPALNYRLGRAGQPELLAYAPVKRGAMVVGGVRLVLAADQPIIAVLRQNTLSSWVLVGFVLGDAALVLALGGFVLTQLVVRPLQAVERAASRVAAGDYSQRVATDGPREIASLAGAFNSMTASVAAQREQLIRTEKLASIGQLAAGVAHEIGNPLSAILGFVDILRTDAAGEGTGGMTRQERRDTLERVKGETQRIHRIIQDLLAYSRPTAEDAAPTDLVRVLDNVEGLLSPQARFKNVRVVRETSAPWPEVVVSAGRLTQVLVNLLINAADAMKGQGRIGVSVTAGDGKVRLCVADEGPGVPPELRSKIFDPFFTTKDPGQGTGLGLPICRSIVEAYGGSLEIEPTPPGAVGARFVVTLPAA